MILIINKSELHRLFGKLIFIEEGIRKKCSLLSIKLNYDIVGFLATRTMETIIQSRKQTLK